MSMVLEVVPPFMATRVDLNKAGDPIKEVVRPARLERSVVIQLMLCGKEIVQQNTLNDNTGIANAEPQVTANAHDESASATM